MSEENKVSFEEHKNNAEPDPVDTAAEQEQTVENRTFILTNENLMELSEIVPMPEGGTLEDFVSEAFIVAQAIKDTGVDMLRLRPYSRYLFLMRAFYLLGVLRGGEAYRATVCDGDIEETWVGDCAFSMDKPLAEIAAKELDTPGLESRKVIIGTLMPDWKDGD